MIHWRTLVEIVDDLASLCRQLCDLYEQFPAIIDEEHQIIKSGTYDAHFAGLCDRKVALGEEVEKVYEQMHEKAKEVLFHACQNFSGRAVTELPNLSGLISVLEDYLDVKDDTQVTYVDAFKHALGRFKKEFALFSDSMRRVKPLIEYNRVVVTTILNNYRESTRFFLEIQEESVSPYDAQGKQKSSGNLSMINVKA